MLYSWRSLCDSIFWQLFFSAEVWLSVSVCPLYIQVIYLSSHINFLPTLAIIPQLSFSDLQPSSFCHSFTSAVTPPPILWFVPLLLRSISWIVDRTVWVCVSSLWQPDFHSADFDGEEMMYSGWGSMEVTGNTPFVVNWQRVYQTSLNQNHWVCQLHNTAACVSDKWCIHDTVISTFPSVPCSLTSRPVVFALEIVFNYIG